MKESFLSNQYLQKSILQKRNDEFDVAFKISTRKVTLRFDDSVFTTKTKCGFFIYLVLHRCLSPGQSWFIAN